MTDPTPTIRRWLPYIHRKAYAYGRLMAGYLDHDDLVSIGMAAAWKACQTYDPARGELGAHVCSVVAQTFSQRYKRARSARRGLRETRISIHPREEDDWLGIEITDASPLAPEMLDAATRAEAVRIAVVSLPSAQDRVVAMRYFDDLQGVEVASRLGVSRQRVHQIEKSALENLRESPVLAELWRTA